MLKSKTTCEPSFCEAATGPVRTFNLQWERWDVQTGPDVSFHMHLKRRVLLARESWRKEEEREKPSFLLGGKAGGIAIEGWWENSI